MHGTENGMQRATLRVPEELKRALAPVSTPPRDIAVKGLLRLEIRGGGHLRKLRMLLA